MHVLNGKVLFREISNPDGSTTIRIGKKSLVKRTHYEPYPPITLKGNDHGIQDR